jgi:rare lipoprotein A (peptidoglycan hydrolase)
VSGGAESKDVGSRRSEAVSPGPRKTRLESHLMQASSQVESVPSTASRALARWAVLVIFLVLAAGCSTKAPSTRSQDVKRFKETGVASWYGKPFHGRTTASGERYNMNKMTAAHKTLPFGVTVKVTNLDNGRSVKVRITDRGPFVKGRIIDLSRAAAKKLDMVGPGTARVRIAVVQL